MTRHSAFPGSRREPKASRSDGVTGSGHRSRQRVGTQVRRGVAPIALVVTLLVAACGGDTTTDEPATTAAGGTTTTRPTRVTLLTHDFFAVPDEVLATFEEDTGIRVEIVRGGDAAPVVNQAILAAGNPVADVLFGVDTTLLSRAVEADLFEPYVSDASVADDLPTAGGLVTPIDLGDVCVNYDIDRVPSVPDSLDDLTGPDLAGQLVVPDPRASSPGLAFMLSTIARFGETGDYTWLDYWADLRSNDVEIAADWGTAYYGSFSGAGTGDRTIVVSYASSPPAEVLFSDPPIDTATTAVMEDGCFRQVEYAAVLRGADHPDAARMLIDFMLSLEFQQSVPTSMFVLPVHPDAELPAVFTDNTIIPADPETLDPDLIEANRERWLNEWSDTMLR